MLQRLDNSTIVSKNDNAAIRTKEAGGGNTNNNNNNNNHHQLRATSMQVQTEENEQQQQQELQNRLDTLRKEVATMKKKVDDMKQRMVHIRNIQRSSSANAILGAAAVVPAGNDVRYVTLFWFVFCFSLDNISCRKRHFLPYYIVNIH